MLAPRRDLDDALARLLPWALALLLALRCGPPLASSFLLQGDLPGHLETMRWYAQHVWPFPWGWDPRYLMGTPVGILYPPLFHWLGGGLGRLLGPEVALKALLLVSIAALPACLAAAARGLGLRRREAAFAAAAGLCVLWLPGPGLGGSLRQTLVAGNAANAFALPLLLALLATLRRGLGRPGRWPLPAALLAACLLSHFLVGAVAGLSVAAFAAFGARATRARRLRRWVAIAGLGSLGAAPFLLPFAVHAREGSPDAIAFAPLPGWAEGIALAVLALFAWAGGRRLRRALGPALALLALLYVLRIVVFPAIGEPAFRMEWQRFRLFLYLALVPAAWLAARGLHPPRPARLLAWTVPAVAVTLAVFFPYDAAGPHPVPFSTGLAEVAGQRVLVLASPAAQYGSWHGLQTRVPNALVAVGAKGLFVEASPFSRAVFEVERMVTAPPARPRWWAIRTSDSAKSAAADRSSRESYGFRLGALGVRTVIAFEPAAPGLIREASRMKRDASGVGLYEFLLPPPRSGHPFSPIHWPSIASSLYPATSPDDVSIRTTADGGQVAISFPASGGRARLIVNAFSDWRVAGGVLERVPAWDPSWPPFREMGPPPKILEARGAGVVTLSVKPRREEWLGLALGAIGFAGIVAGAALGRRAAVSSRA